MISKTKDSCFPCYLAIMKTKTVSGLPKAISVSGKSMNSAKIVAQLVRI